MTDNDVRQHGKVSATEGAVPHSQDDLARQRFPIVGIGASAGGLDALRTLFQAMPTETGMGFVVIQHLDAEHRSLLADLLGKFTTMEVVQAEHGISVEPDHIYVIPPNAYLTISDAVLLLSPPTWTPRRSRSGARGSTRRISPSTSVPSNCGGSSPRKATATGS